MAAPDSKKDLFKTIIEEVLERGEQDGSQGDAQPATTGDINTNGGAVIIGNGNNIVVNARALNVTIVLQRDDAFCHPSQKIRTDNRWLSREQPVESQQPERRFGDAEPTRSPAVQKVLKAITPGSGTGMIDITTGSAKSRVRFSRSPLEPAQSVPNRAAPPRTEEPPSTPQFALMSKALARLKARRGLCQNDHLPTDMERP